MTLLLPFEPDLYSDEEIGSIERAYADRGSLAVVGVDEAGRGPLAGPVVVAAVRLDLAELDWAQGLDDSKRLSAAARDHWFDRVRENATFQIVEVPPSTIDRLNILGATLFGMRECVEALAPSEDEAVLVDGKTPIPSITARQRCLVGGDRRSWAVAAASVLAKVTRDRHMRELDAVYPGYGFARHKGYPTKAHFEALDRLGPCPEHRVSFAPVRERAREAGRPDGQGGRALEQ